MKPIGWRECPTLVSSESTLAMSGDRAPKISRYEAARSTYLRIPLASAPLNTREISAGTPVSDGGGSVVACSRVYSRRARCVDVSASEDCSSGSAQTGTNRTDRVEDCGGGAAAS